MKQPIKNNKNKKSEQKKKVTTKTVKKAHPQYGTSKLEEDFAHDFLDKLGVKYMYQFEAKDIGRFFDFFILPSGPIIEIDGSYWHGDSRLYEEKDLNRTQKRAQRIDEYKNHWALSHGYTLLRIWEKDIREKPKEVLKELKQVLYIDDKNEEIKSVKIGNKKIPLKRNKK